MHGFATVLYMRSWTISIVAGAFSTSFLPELLSWPCLSGFLCLTLLLQVLRNSALSRSLLCFSLGFVLGHYQGFVLLDERLPKAWEGQWLDVEGIVAGVPLVRDQNSRKYQRFIFDVTAIDCGESMLDCPRKLGKIRLSYYGQRDILPAENWRFTVKLKRPRGMLNPNGFDLQAWLVVEGFAATGYVKKGSESTINRVSSGLFDWKQGGGIYWRYTYHRWRQDIALTVYRTAKDKRAAAMIVALTTGIRHYLSQHDRQLFQRAGISHLMAISGLHVGMVAGVSYLFFSLIARFLVLLWPRIAGQYWALGGSFITAAIYALMAGFTLPTQRAMIMLAFLQLALATGKRRCGLDALGIALLVIAVTQPLAVHSASFWLSFFAVLAIFFLLWSRPIKTGLEQEDQLRYLSDLKSWMWVQIGICIFLIPLTVFWFSGFSLIAPLINAFAIPLISFLVVPLSLFATLWLGFSRDVSVVCWQIAAYPLRWLVDMSEALVKLGDDFAWSDTAISPLALLSLSVAMFWVYFFPLKRVKLLALLLLGPVIFPQIDRPGHGAMHLTVLDVGQGLSVVVETRSHTLVYDVGPLFISGFNTGEAVVKPFLLSRQITAVDRLLISHGDNDHAGGARGLFDSIPVKLVLSGEPEALSFDAKSCHHQQHWQWDGVKFQVLHPFQNEWFARANNLSCVLKISAEGFSVLLPGDIGKKVERKLVNSLADGVLRSDILLVAHHGSNSSSSDGFLDAVGPAIAVVSAGYLNRYQHPRDEVLKRLQKHGAEVFNTADSGAISFLIADGEIERIEESRRSKNYFWY